MHSQVTYLKKRGLSIAAMTILFTAVSLFYYFGFITNQIQTTVYINFGAALTQNISPYETSESADAFSEMVQGWFKDPVFLKTVKNQTTIEPSFNIKKQEKQTLILTFNTKSETLNNQISKIVQDQLNQYVNSYNKTNKSEFTISSFDSVTDKNPSNPAYIIFAAIIIGILLGYYSNRLRDYLFE